MKILGLIGYPGSESHDAAAALFIDGDMVSAAEQERFSRIKHAPGESPIDAALFCLKTANLTLADVDYITYGWAEKSIAKVNVEISDWISVNKEHTEKLLPKEIFGYKKTPPIFFVKHHIAHINCAFYESGFNDAACLIVDGRGETESITLAEVKNDKINIIKKFDIPSSLGLFYEAAAKYTGLGFYVPGKLMGLAPYGIPDRKNLFMSFNEKRGELNLPFPKSISGHVGDSVTGSWIKYFKENCYPYKEGSENSLIYYINFAATAQKTLETVVLSLLKYLRKHTTSKNLVISGGVGLNCPINSIAYKSKLFKNYFTHPASNDAGCSIGSIYEICRHFKIKIKKKEGFPSPFLGPEYSNQEIKNELEKQNVKYTYLEEDVLIDKVSTDLVNDKICCWFQGRTEIGPRALGNRSILANPSNRENLYKLNKIKKRELWRPLAPSVLEENFNDIFEGSYSKSFAKYMLTIAKIKKEWVKKIPAVLHVDKSTRPQSVGNIDKRYYSLIKAFYKKTGIPLVVNTSFNLGNEPIVNSPKDAIDSFLKDKELNVLAIGNFYIKK